MTTEVTDAGRFLNLEMRIVSGRKVG
jgi:hypothetical protein